MENLTYLQPEIGNEDHRVLLETLTIPYNRELDSHVEDTLSVHEIRAITGKMLSTAGHSETGLELCYLNGELVGFWYGKVDTNVAGIPQKRRKAAILEFYIRPCYRRRGLGSAMYRRAVEVLERWGANRLELTADPVTGVAFWRAMGFKPNGKKDECYGFPILEKNLAHE